MESAKLTKLTSEVRRRESGSSAATHKEEEIEMAKDTATLILNGEVVLADYAKAINSFLSLIVALQSDYASGARIDWKIEELETGSTTTTVRGIVETETDIPAVEQVVTAYEGVGESVVRGDISAYSSNVQSAVNELINISNGRIPSLRFETVDTDWEISRAALQTESPVEALSGRDFTCDLEAHGAVKGRIQSLSREKRHRFTLYELNTHQPVRCFLTPDYEEIMREAWGKLAIVEGIVRRNPETGLPTSVRQVKALKILPEEAPGAWREALGCAPDYTGGVPPAEAVRRLRDD